MLLQNYMGELALPECCSCEIQFSSFVSDSHHPSSFLSLKNINVDPTKLCTEVYSENLPRMTLDGHARSPESTLGLTLGTVRSGDLDKRVMT